jgi:SEC-C motif
MTVGRNEPCPCGSNRKYKNCHAGKSTRGTSKGLIILLAAIGVIAAVGAVASLINRNKPATPAPRGVAGPSTAGRPQPGPAPPGQVWSTEHGHWHDARTGQQPGQAPPRQTVPLNIPAQTTQAPQYTPGPQPPGPVPPGKVWSTEHGHWHDAPK